MIEIIKAELKSHKWLFIGTPIVLLILNILALHFNSSVAKLGVGFAMCGLFLGLNISSKFIKNKINYFQLPMKISQVGSIRIFVPYFYSLLTVICGIIFDLAFGNSANASFISLCGFCATFLFVWSYYTLLDDLAYLLGTNKMAIGIILIPIAALPFVALFLVFQQNHSAISQLSDFSPMTLVSIILPLFSILSCRKRASYVPVIIKIL